MFERKTKFTPFLFTFIGGVIAGGAVALLLTPMTGRKMQKKVADVADKVIDKVDDLQGAVRRLATA